MGIFRIAFGTASCQTYSGNNSNIKEVCKLVLQKIAYLKSLQFSQLLNWKNSETDIGKIAGKEVLLTAYQQKNEKGELLIIVQAFYPTLKFPNYFSFSFIGKVFANGFIVDSAGSIRDATDSDLWSFR